MVEISPDYGSESALKMVDPCGRFFVAMDMNGDSAFTVTDVWSLAQFAFFLPAKLALWLASSRAPEVATFFEIDCGTGGDLGGAIFSFLAWWIGGGICYFIVQDAIEETTAAYRRFAGRGSGKK